MKKQFLFYIAISWTCLAIKAVDNIDDEHPPEGYYAFVKAPNAEPPRVRPPPYSFPSVDCVEDRGGGPQASVFNICGDLNKGSIPRNPMGQNVLGSRYPFGLIKNMTLKYLSRTLPILKADETLPIITQVEQQQQQDALSQNSLNPYQTNDRNYRVKRSKEEPATPVKQNKTASESGERKSRKFCDQGGIFCSLYKVINGDSDSSQGSPAQLPIERRDDNVARYDGPPTPCPAKVEYATPVFAKNYQGIWRYVVQIPYEGYFTQTIEVTRCVQSRCHYLDGGCLSSPRWSSLLVAEINYPDTVLGSNDVKNIQRNPVPASQAPPFQDYQDYHQYLQKRTGLQPGLQEPSSTTRPTHCDGIDALGCFQVRLYYDWFLIPGSCKCWRPDYFNKYVRRKSDL
ncbi:spaetzle domain-containing protein 6 [Rhynchophorus ferrugineus]|uniref:spaetzle domain-containing protein 6 n=1 Tax=Rhynchophorus ferrugineus TaxID=354439 RepID=UPI003FCC8BD6